MKLLIVSATESEIAPLLQHLQQSWPSPSPLQYKKQNASIDCCIAGVGMVATTYAVTKALNGKYDFVLQAGIGGSFKKGIAPGDIVFITSEQFGDLGAEDIDNYLDIFEMGLVSKDVYPFSGAELTTPVSTVHQNILLPRAKGLTVNTVSGNERTIKLRNDRYNCDVESMEGVAFHYVCLQEKVPFAQVRSISNYVTPRNRSAWRMKEAIIGLNKWLIDFIETL